MAKLCMIVSIIFLSFFIISCNDDKECSLTNKANLAKVFPINPVKTPIQKEVYLLWVDDNNLDPKGYLTAREDLEGIRKIKVFNCPDLGDTVLIPEEFMGFEIEIPICTPTQIANKIENHNFVYDSNADLGAFNADKIGLTTIDVHSEVNLYYHVSKIYNYLIKLGFEGFTKLSGHETELEKLPLNVIANFKMPDLGTVFSNDKTLGPMDNAMFVPTIPIVSDFIEDFGIKGDVLIFGQGVNGSWAYDGEVVYHEFGHATIHSTAQLSLGSFPDRFGINNQSGSLHEGLADTISLFISPDSCLGEYAAQTIVDYYNLDMDPVCIRYSENDKLVNESFTGEVHNDGEPMAAANWEILNLAYSKELSTNDKNAKDLFAGLIMKTLMSMADPKGGYKYYAETLLDIIEEDIHFKALKSEIEEIFIRKGFFNEIRARDASNGIEVIFAGGTETLVDLGTVDTPFIEVEEKGKKVLIAPAFLQFYYKMPANRSTLVISGNIGTGMDLIPTLSSNPKFKLYIRAKQPILYSLNNDNQIIVTKARIVEEEVIENEESIEKRNWTIEDLESDETYYFQFINYGGMSGSVKNIELSSKL